MRWIPLLASFAAMLPLVAQAATPEEQTKTPSTFVRFVKVGDGGHLDTAITTYEKDGVELVLFGAVHIADRACYQLLNDRFQACDVLLYELVGPEDYRPTKDRDEGFNPLGMLQNGLKSALELSFQLDEIDYQANNFVHADMTPEEFQQSMEERGESILSIMFDMMMSGAKQQRELSENGDAEPVPEFDLVKAFRNGEGRHLMRMMFGQQMQQIEELTAGGKDGTLLQGRNEKCLSVLRRELDNGHKKIGIYYGAAHFPHMERRLVQDLGFVKKAHEWIVAWDCKKRPDVRFDRKLYKQKQQCREELAALIAAAAGHRIDQHPDEVPTPTQLQQLRAQDKPVYAGPLQDPWGSDYVLQKRSAGVRWQAVSCGPDQQLGTEDDLLEVEPRRGRLGR
ncbi:MAG: type II secretion system protein GspG [Planctomycetes bacterium]|nr:type II secretion system protein GspG [Planctomycetota bacterium]